ncbi:hypothetical protein Nepgr_003806 [Nepenthes gracilis]|uniref:Fe2OG dioxygenase domain-containing protein n=1 Tax=Nepenthes gracilis TaxID=150966 RepID=A0AAD3S0A0_NEPGR|nr:hypothetical protein Nepgr_003806 [Nepenthes gracilis]
MSTNSSSGGEASATSERHYELKEFDDAKIGVKGLVDSGVTVIPRIFRHPPESLSDLKPLTGSESARIPIIDISGLRSTVVEQIRSASSIYGFFQVINHGVPISLLDRLVNAVKSFNELPQELKAPYYRREMSAGVSFFSNVDLFLSKAASWRDTLQIRLGPVLADSTAIPDICRNEVIEWDQKVKQLGESLMGLLSEGLGLSAQRLKDMSCLEARVMVGHYYPYCPEPDQTVGISSHTDPGVLTVLLQDLVGGLQIKYEGKWLDVKPVHGALVINIGDILQIMSNDEYKSVEHRVLANPLHEPRVSIAVFLNPSERENPCGPLPGLVSPQRPALYREFMISDFMKRFFTKELDGKTLTDFYRNET